MAKSTGKPSGSKTGAKKTKPASKDRSAGRAGGAPGSKAKAGATAIPVVGLGASAGGLDAFSGFLDAMQEETGMAFVIVHHADPDHESLMADILSKHTAMKVTQAKDRTHIEPDHVYVIPPNRFLSIKNGVLKLSEPEAPRGVRLPIDYFLRSLAEDQEKRAVAVILSGTGSDGAAGVRSIKANGGMVLVQNLREAAHDGMPHSAIATGSVDHILPVAKMPDAILSYTAHPYSATDEPHPVLGDGARDALPDIIEALKAYSTINFELYKKGTLQRRIERRMALRHMENAGDYLALLRDSPEEAKKLCADLLINVTAFFREAEAFDYLTKTVLPEILGNKASGEPVRIWVPACATGEEAYSLGMLLIEKMSTLRKNVQVQIFASDVDEEALSIARNGVYPDSIAADINPERLSRFFVKEDNTYRVKPELRDAIVFAHHNVLSDAPFSRLDLISCRNLLIYLNSDSQERIIDLFHFALSEGGFLFLGSSETADRYEHKFRTQSRKHRIYKRVGKARHRRIDFPIANHPTLGPTRPLRQSPSGNHGQKLADLSLNFLVERYAPAAVLIDEQMQTLFVQGPTDQYLKVPPGEANQNVLAMAREGLRAKLRSTVRKALQSERKAVSSASVIRDHQTVPVRITAHPLAMDEATLILVCFTDLPINKKRPDVTGAISDAAHVAHLEEELAATQQELQNTIRDFEISTEELKASNEEAMSLNEEFQSTNEELETSKEELQSLNEELTTLNTQLQQKIDDERHLSDDLENFLSGSGIATLFLDRQFNIMRFTPASRDLFNVIATDIGRPFSDITGKIRDPKLLADGNSVLEDLAPVEREVRSDDGKWFIRKIIPYRTRDSKIDGIVVTYTDVSKLKDLQTQLEDVLKFWENIVDTVREPLLVLDEEFAILRANRSFLNIFSMTAETTVGHSLFKIGNGQWDCPDLKKLLGNVLTNETTIEDYELKMAIEGLGLRTLLINARRVRNGTGGRKMILLAAEDVTVRLDTQRGLADREARLRAFLDAAPEAIITTDEHGSITSYSPAGRTILGYSAEEIIGQNVKMLMPEPHHKNHDGYMAHYLETGEKHIIGKGREVKARRKDGSEVPVHLTVSEWNLGEERNFVGILHDLSEDVRRRMALQEAQKMNAVGQLTGGLAHDFNNLLTVITGNLELLEMRLGDFDGAELLMEALEASDLGAKLTSQLLSFARKQEFDPVAISLNELIIKLKPMLARTLGEQISVATDLAKDLSPIVSDPGQIENAILNLAINARDAMPDGGRLTIATKNTVLDEDYAATQVDVEPGNYVALSVTDTGVGMTPETVEQIFEPFFTTKGIGEGSGLGLSMVYGFVKQSGGHATVYSEPGIGTSVTLYLRRASPGEKTVAIPEPHGVPENGSEKILVVEDDARVRRLTVSRLQNLGYRVIEAEDGPSALDILHSGAQIDLVLSDIVMPGGLNGFQVAEKALEAKPDIRVLLTTGYASKTRVDQIADRNRHPILRKPYSLGELSEALRALLD